MGSLDHTLADNIDIEWLHEEAYKRTRKDGATGVDGAKRGRVCSGP
jgi:hypothetical protein